MATSQSGGGIGESKGRKGKRGHVRSPLLPGVLAPLESLLEALEQLEQQLKEATSQLQPDKNILPLPSFLPAVQQASRLVSDNCTKLAVLFSSPPAPTPVECAAMTSKMEQSATHLLATYYQLSPLYGTTLHREVQNCARSILQGAVNIVTTIIVRGTSSVSEGLRGTGSVWEHCEAVTKISRDNKGAVVKVLISQLHLLRDACREAEEVEEEGGRGEEEDLGDWGVMDGVCEGVKSVELGGEEEEEGDDVGEGGGPREWTETEKQLAEPSIQLVKLGCEVASEVCRVVISNGACQEDGQVRELDETAAAVQRLSPAVDELVGELAAPVQLEQCRKAGGRLATALTQLLHTASSSHFCLAAGDNWSSTRERCSDSLSALRGNIAAVTKPQLP